MALVLILITSLLAVSTCSGSLVRQFPPNRPNSIELNAKWALYTTQHNKTYGSAAESDYRRQIWEDRVLEIEKHNAEADLGLHTWWMGLNQFSDMTPEEFALQMLSGVILDKGDNSLTVNESESYPTSDLPASVDWRKKGVVTPIKNQGRCGSCWAFSAVGALEGAYAIRYGHLVSLSEQELVDCSGRYGNYGCRGGFPWKAIQYVIDNRGIDTESCYSYKAVQQTCRRSSSCIGATAKSMVSVRGESTLQGAVANKGPVSVTMCVPASFMSYRSGIYQGVCTRTSGMHALVAVGYGPGYWLIKNSWGAGWGEQGYVRIARNAGNVCGIASDGVYPVV